MSSWAMAGTTKAITGRSRSTIVEPPAGVEAGRKSTVIPAFIGL